MTRGSQLLPRVYEILVILASKYMGLMGDSRASVRDSALILASVAAPSFNRIDKIPKVGAHLMTFDCLSFRS